MRRARRGDRESDDRAYGPGIVIIHGNQPGVDTAFATAAKELGVTAEPRVIDRNQSGHPTIGARNRALLMGGADMCIAVHRNRSASVSTKDFAAHAIAAGIPMHLIGSHEAVQMELDVDDPRLGHWRRPRD